jgi:hypothetical protein
MLLSWFVSNCGGVDQRRLRVLLRDDPLRLDSFRRAGTLRAGDVPRGFLSFIDIGLSRQFEDRFWDRAIGSSPTWRSPSSVMAVGTVTSRM